MYKASVNKKSFEIESSADGLIINNKAFTFNFEQIEQGYFHVIGSNNRSYTAEIVKADFGTKSFQIKVNGRNYLVGLKDQFDLLLEKMGLNNTASGKVNNIKAPMPGLIIDMKVTAGDLVKSGDSLLILEAMKMENIIKSPGEGIVKSVKVKKGESVEKNQVLIEF
jgi:biotin carboxyl carrier protein